jgi:hypothetical protein
MTYLSRGFVATADLHMDRTRVDLHRRDVVPPAPRPPVRRWSRGFVLGVALIGAGAGFLAAALLLGVAAAWLLL